MWCVINWNPLSTNQFGSRNLRTPVQALEGCHYIIYSYRLCLAYHKEQILSSLGRSFLTFARLPCGLKRYMRWRDFTLWFVSLLCLANMTRDWGWSNCVHFCLINFTVVWFCLLLSDCPVDSKDTWDVVGGEENTPFSESTCMYTGRPRQGKFPWADPGPWEFRGGWIKAGWAVGWFTTQQEAEHAFSPHIILPRPLCEFVLPCPHLIFVSIFFRDGKR